MFEKVCDDIHTPCYVYDLPLLRRTIDAIKESVGTAPVMVHYAVKANHNERILKSVAASGLGADCVSIGEIRAAVAAGFRPSDIVFAGVAKTDDEILSALALGIGCFNVESVEELGVISQLSEANNFVAPVALRVNPNIDAHTHHYITTGLEENKFGINLDKLDEAVDIACNSGSIALKGLHFHIGSQITTMEPFEQLTQTINQLLSHFAAKSIFFESINVGGGLGIDYDNPSVNDVADFRRYFTTIIGGLRLSAGQTVHFELGRSIVAQCGALLSRVVYVKHGTHKKFVILDAGMNCLIRPALYGARHEIVNMTAVTGNRHGVDVYDVVGPICESSDVFAVDKKLPETRRGDVIAVLSAGAYGESMSSSYNLRQLNPPVYID